MIKPDFLAILKFVNNILHILNSSTTLLRSIMLMALHPKVQTKCQNELSEIIGEKPPTIEDMKDLKFIMATVMEIQRYSIVAQASLPHYLLHDTTVNQYKFQKGTIFFCNLTKFMTDPTVFTEPRTFKPERFIDENGNICKNENFVPFGIGKRICMGDSLAKNELFIFFVRILQRMNIGVVDGKIPNPENYVSGITRIPLPFLVSVSPRS